LIIDNFFLWRYLKNYIYRKPKSKRIKRSDFRGFSDYYSQHDT